MSLKKFLLTPFFLSFIPFVYAGVDLEVHKLCLPAADYAGCVKAMKGDTGANRIIMDQGVSLSEGNACPEGYAYKGGGTCQIVECYGSGLFLTIGGANDPILKKYGWRDNCPRAYPLVTYGDATTRAFNDPKCPSREPGVGFNSTCHEEEFALKEKNDPEVPPNVNFFNEGVEINCNSPVWKKRPQCN